MRSVYLIGFMGAGKTTVGKLLGKQLGLAVYDVDALIEKKQRRTIKEIFAVEGEKYFRGIESLVLKDLPSEHAVITTGGGVISRQDNMTYMKEKGIVIYLGASFDTIRSRLKGSEERPLFTNQDIERVKTLYENRIPLYQEAHVCIQTDGKTALEIVEEIQESIKHWSQGYTS